MSFKGLLRSGTGFIVLAAPMSAHAAEAEPSNGDIVVTAERTNRTLRETASSVVVTTQDDIDRLSGDYSTDDILSRIPNLVSTRPSNGAPAVRGLDGTGPARGAHAFFAGTRRRMNLQMEGRTPAYNKYGRATCEKRGRQ